MKPIATITIPRPDKINPDGAKRLVDWLRRIADDITADLPKMERGMTYNLGELQVDKT